MNTVKTLKMSLEFLLRCTSWEQLYLHIHSINISDEVGAGRLFEVFCKHYLKVKGDFKEVFLLNEVNPSLLRNLNIEKKDHGCDIIVQLMNGQYGAVQCKFTSNESNKVLQWTKDRLSSFLAASTKVKTRIIITNASGVSPAVVRKARELDYRQIDYQHLVELSQEDFLLIHGSIKENPSKRSLFSPRPHQKLAIQKVIQGFEKNDRGKLILPCGAGKTLTSLWVKEKIGAKKTLVLVPSLSLLRQFKNDWRAQENEVSDYFCVCSEKDIIDSDSPSISTFEVGGFVTTDPLVIRRLLKTSGNQVVYSTYQSSSQVAQALNGSDFCFDLVICDEAHRTSGATSSVFATVLNNDKIRASKRLFMTATPKIISPVLKRRLSSDELAYIADMSSKELYGDEFFRLNFGEAIKMSPPILVDYKIIAVGVTDIEIKEYLRERRFAKGTIINEIAHNYALHKVMTEYDARHAVTFHSRVSAADSFKSRHKAMFASVDAYHVSGNQSSSERIHDLLSFEQSPNAVITNARCLTEGVDVPAIDLVYFCDPKSSKIDIVQSTGRALRTYKGKQLGLIVVPLFHRKGSSVEDVIDNDNYRILVNVIRAMSDQDARIEEEILKLKYGRGLSETPTDVQVTDGHFVPIELTGFEEKLRKSLFTQIIDRSVIKWRSFEKARAYVHSLKLRTNKEWRFFSKSKNRPADIPVTPEKTYKNLGWKSYGDWLGTGAIHKGLIPFSSFQESRSFVHCLALKNEHAWREYVKSGAKPEKIPSAPQVVYRSKGWAGFGDWLGTGSIRPRDKVFLPFSEARTFIRALKLKNRAEWRKYSISGVKPTNIPADPANAYKNEGWVNFGDWLGTNFLRAKDIKYWSFQQSRQFARKLKLKNQSEWRCYSKSEDKPPQLPADPGKVYKEIGWEGYGDWLGTGYVAAQQRQYLSYELAKKYVRKLKFKNNKQWREYAKSERKPSNVPSNPEVVYKNSGWEGYGDWLGTFNESSHSRKFLSYEEARKIVRKAGLKNIKEWRSYCISGEKPYSIPSNPHKIYKDKGWKGYIDWLS